MRSAQNAIKHGMYAQNILLHWEDFDGYEALRHQLFVDHEPCTAAKYIHIDQILHSYFLSRRAFGRCR